MRLALPYQGGVTCVPIEGSKRVMVTIMKVLQVLPDLKKCGGVEQGVVDLARRYPDIVWVASAGGRLAADLTHHITLPLHTKNPFKMIMNGFALAQAVRKHDIDLLHVRSRAPAWSVRLACFLTQKPWIATYHGLYNAHNFFKRYYNSIMTRGKTVIAISDWVARHIRATYPHACISVIHEGIDTNHFDIHDAAWGAEWRRQNAISDTKKVIVLPGRLTRWKGQHILLEAAQYLDDNWEIVFLGDTQQYHYVEKLKKMALDLPMKVHFLPSCKDMRWPYAGADVVVSCSTDPEAFGRITAEALSMGRAYVGTHHGGSVELTDHGRYGTLVPYGDPRALARALTQVQPHIAARAFIQKHYDVNVMYEQTIALYQSLCV